MKDIYSRELKLSFNTINFLKKDIITRHDKPLNFYQKNIILILEKGLQAISLNDLSDKLSYMLNIKKNIVNDFVEKLFKMDVLTNNSKKYILSEKFNYSYNDEYKDIMIANTELGKDTVAYIYIPSIDTLLTQKILDENELTQTEFKNDLNSESLVNNLFEQIQKLNKKNIPTKLAKYSIKNYVCNDVEIAIQDFIGFQTSKIIIPVKLTYEYDIEKGCGVLIDANINLHEDSEINKYVDKENFISKISIVYKEDNKKPDYIIYEEALLEEENKKIELKKIKQDAKEIQDKHQKTKNAIDLIKQTIENKNLELKILKNQISKLQQDNKEYQEKVKQIKTKEQELITAIESSKIKELNKKYSELKTEYANKTKEYDQKINEYQKKHEKLHVDAFEKKLYTFEQNNNKLYGTHLYVYQENKKLKENLLKMSKKINDNSSMVDEWFYLYQAFTSYIKYILSIMLNRETNTINSIKSELDEGIKNEIQNSNNRTTLGVKYNFRGNDCDSLVLLEKCADHFRHKYFDSKDNYFNFKRYHPKVAQQQIDNYNKFLNLSKEEKKELLYTIVYMFEMATTNKDNLTKLNNIIKEEYEKTTE